MFASFSRTISASRLFSLSTAVDDIICRDDLSEILSGSDPQGDRAIVSYVERQLPKILSAAQRTHAKGIATENAALIIDRFIHAHPNASDAIRRVVPSTISAFAKKGVLPPAVALASQRILVAAFQEDFSQTSYGVNIALGDEIVHGAIRNLAQSSAVGDTLIALFGSALNATTMMLPSTTPNIFTDLWVRLQFPLHVSAYCQVAMTTLDHTPYFLFMQDLFKRGLSHSAGPIVDALLTRPTFSLMLHAVLDAALSPTPDAFPLASDGLQLLAAVAALMRKTFPPTDSSEQYRVAIQCCAPVDELVRSLPQLVAILENRHLPSAVRRVGLARLAVLEVLLELIQFNLLLVDSALVKVEVMAVVMNLWEANPNHDVVARVVEKLWMSIFSRKCSNFNTNEHSDALLETLYFAEAPVLLRKLIDFATNDSCARTSLQATSLNISLQLHETPWFTPDGPAKHGGYFAHLLQLQAAATIHTWMSPNTGTAFGARGSGCPGFTVVHRALRDPGNVSAGVTPSNVSDDEITLEERAPPVAVVSALPNSVVVGSLSSAASSNDRGSRYLRHPQDSAGSHPSRYFDPLNGSDEVEPEISPPSPDPMFTNFDGDDDEVLLDTAAMDVPPIDNRRASLECVEDDDWVEKTIHDVTVAVDGS